MRKVKWGVIGAGGIADRRTIPGMLLAQNAELVAIMEVNMELAEKIRAKYNAKKAYDNVDALLTDPDVEAVYIASPVIFHKEQAIKAAKAGKHILIEKPLALTVKDGEEVLEACKKNKVKIAAGFMMRFHPYHQKLKEMIQGGAIGSVVSCGAQFTCWYPDMENAWRQNKAQSGGGALMDMGVHCIDLIQFITGEKAIKVAALNKTKTFQYEVEDSSSVLFELDNGAFCHVDSNFNIPDAAAKWRIEFYGTKGRIIADETIGQVEGGKLDVLITGDGGSYDAKQEKEAAVSSSIDVEFGNMYAREIESFGESLLTGKSLAVPAEEAIQVQRIVEAAYESAECNKFVFI